MSIERVTGNLLDMPSGVSVILHCVSRQGVMNAGLGKQIREEFPAAYDAYMAAFRPPPEGSTIKLKMDAPPLGSLIPAEVGNGKRVISAVAQDEIGTDKRQIDYEALYVCLEQTERLLRDAQEAGRPWVLGLPLNLGCGLSGGAWSIVEAMIERVFAASPIRCVIVGRQIKAPEQPASFP